jgi:hypothetical protein
MDMQRRCSFGIGRNVVSILRVMIMKMLMRRTVAMPMDMGMADKDNLSTAQWRVERVILRFFTMVVAVMIMRMLYKFSGIFMGVATVLDRDLNGKPVGLGNFVNRFPVIFAFDQRKN